MDNTKLKFEEAEFFFVKLNNVNQGSKEFNFYLNAFVSSARSVTWVMKAEFGNSENWKKWYEEQNPSEEEKELLKYFNKLRIETNKIKPLKASHYLEFNVPAEEVTEELIQVLEELKGKKGEIIFAKNQEELEGIDGIILGRNILFKSCLFRVNNLDSNYEIIIACEKYLESLRNLVKKCKKKFCT